MSRRIVHRFVISAAMALVGLDLLATVTVAHADESPAMEFVCVDGGAGLSAVDVLEATGQHGVFLDHLRLYDPEGYEILTDPALSDKTVWAPTDAAFEKLGNDPQTASPEKIKAVLGFHITPPRRSTDGDYPIITFDYLANGGQIIHQTRTGILTGSDQRVRTVVENGAYTVEGKQIESTAWCTQAGSVFAIDEVITEVAEAGWFDRTLGLAIYYAFFEYPYLTIVAVLVLIGVAIWIAVRRVRARRRPS